MRKTKTIEIIQSTTICRFCEDELEEEYCHSCKTEYLGYEDQIIYCDKGNHYCEKCGKKRKKKIKK